MFNDRKLMTKKAWKEKQKALRVTNGFNTGTRDMKTEKYPTRQKNKNNLKKMLDKSDY